MRAALVLAALALVQLAHAKLPPPGRFDIGGDGTPYVSVGFPYGQTLCTNAGGTITLSTGTEIPSPLVIPSDCKPQRGTTKDQCNSINQLWLTKIAYCCPTYAAFVDWGYYPQLKKNDPALAAYQFPSALLNPLGVTSPAKWIGSSSSNTGGCVLFFQCNNLLTKADCTARGGICVWDGKTCSMSQTAAQTFLGLV